MIVRVPGWSWEVRGGGITLVPDAGGGAIRYRERLRPVLPVAAILRAKQEDPRFTVTSISPIERFVTMEGEYAAAVDIAGELGGRPMARTLAFVFADDWYSEIAGIATDPDRADVVAATVRALARDTRLVLGARRRPFVYRPPHGWFGYRRLPQYATWFPPEHPRDPTSIEVYPALPVAIGDSASHSATSDPEHVVAAERIALLAIGPPTRADVLGELTARTPITTARLGGSAWELDIRDEQGRALTRRLVILRDERYVYSAYLDTPASDLDLHRPILADLLDSIEPLPTAGNSTAPISYHWF